MTEQSSSQTYLNEVKFDDSGLIPAIAQDAESGRILMVAWMNRESLALTLEKGQAVYWSRSRQKLWRKGESSGNVQNIREVRLDCDGDALVLQVGQIGGIACHTGRESCFFRIAKNGGWETTDDVLKTPEEIYGNE